MHPVLGLERLPMRVQIGMAVGSLVDLILFNPVVYLYITTVWYMMRCDPAFLRELPIV